MRFAFSDLDFLSLRSDSNARIVTARSRIAGMNRRQFLQSAAASAAACALPAGLLNAAADEAPTVARLPRWRGFNLLEWFDANNRKTFKEEDFALIKELGFDFVRLPLSYRCWNSGKVEEWDQIDEKALAQIDQAVELGKQHGVHVNINFHRAPGYCVNPPKEPLVLWDDEKALDACAHHWGHFAKRYKGRPSREVTFDLLNEPADIPEEKYTKVVKRLVEAIHEQDRQRLVIADGLKWGGTPVMSLAGLVAQSTRGYEPSRISHYKANWMKGSDEWPEPTWPLTVQQKDKKQEVWDRAKLVKNRIDPWKKLEEKGSGVHVGEWGSYNKTPHAVALKWMQDYLELWKQAGWGWAMWNFRGAFGPLDSGRADVAYETWKGHKLDRKMMELIQAH
jgi:endoglucanase